ncbi:uncharacterized protein LOC110712981 [Chenopodium quinoa]|uniref:uncharacterized protein LOC110712981 n=1 Tax=Chenopodium quinoa TaxID=63459 RepID=UPI000B7768DF|nr:uncharacterized protein LOC110712981 [Chenopodium quinoa]
MDKSEVSFSQNIDQERKNMLQMKLSFKAVEGHDEYLGLPTYIGGFKKHVFQNIHDRIWKKLKGWKEQYLSQAGKEVLIKSIAQAIPTYAMQCFLIPTSILNVVERLCRQFFWEQRKEENKICWVAWEKMYVPKVKEVLVLETWKFFNKALLAKQAWRILSNEESLMEKVLKGKYFPHSNFMETKISPNSSYTWRSILGARDVLKKGVRRNIGDGVSTHIWRDPWIPTLKDFNVASTKPDDALCPLYVCQLWSDKSWNFDVLNQVFF